MIPRLNCQIVIHGTRVAATRTQKGLTVRGALDTHVYPKAVKVTAAQMAIIQLTPHTFHGDWNYTIRPAKTHE